MGEILHFPYNTRLMCPNCLRVSNTHITGDMLPFDENSSCMLVYHICKCCGSTDAPYSDTVDLSKCNVQFIDSGNYESAVCNPNITNDAERQIKLLKQDLQYYEKILADSEKEYAELWLTDEDR